MRVCVVSGLRAGSLYAHAINTVKMAQGFARLGHDVTVICRTAEAGRGDPAALARTYALDTPLRWVQVAPKWGRDRPGIDWRFVGRVLPHVLRLRPGLVFTRDYVAPAVLSRLGVPTVVESHAHPGTDSKPFRKLLGATHRPTLRGWLTISDRLAEHYVERGVPREKVWVLPDAVDLRQFSRPERMPPSPFEGEGPHAVYAGHLYDYKGVPTVLHAAQRLPTTRFHIVGGWPQDIARQRAVAETLRLHNTTFHGLVDQVTLPRYLWHADVLLLPPSADHPSAAWTSPVKLGEYLASRVPVVASDIPALRDWLDDTQAEFFTPDDAHALADAIRRVLDDPGRRVALIEAGWHRAQGLSYEVRAAEVLRRAGFEAADQGITGA